jgi:serine/threonine protein kinase
VLVDASDRQSDPLLGRTLGGVYAVEQRLGTGGFGAVYAGRHVRTGRRYALKVLRPDRALLSPEARERFRREAAALASLGHAGIVAVHDYASSDGFDYLVMDLLEGEDLASRLAHTAPLPLEDALRIVEQVADALALAHRQGIVHRDLKPANVFLARSRGEAISGSTRPSDLTSGDYGERAVLLDFGLAKTDAGGPSLTASGEALGTPQYMAPEQASGDRIDARTDVYALGAILFEMLSGAPPFDGPSPAAVLVKALTTPAPSLRGVAGVPSTVADVVARALAKDPELRPPSVTDFVLALRSERPESLLPETRAMAVVTPRSTERPPPTRVSGARDSQGSDVHATPRGLPIWAVALGATLLVGGGVLAYALFGEEGAPPELAQGPSATPNEATPNEATPNEATPNEATPNEATPNEAVSPELAHEATPNEGAVETAPNEATPQLGAPPIEPTPDPLASPRASRPPRRLVASEAQPTPASPTDSPTDSPTASPSATGLPTAPPAFDYSGQRTTLLRQADAMDAQATAIDTLFPPIDRIRQGLGPLREGNEPTFCGRDVGLPRGSDEPAVVATSQSLRSLVERACQPFENLRNPSTELRQRMRDLLDRDLPRALEMSRETSSSNQPVEVAREVEAGLLELQRALDGVVEGRRPFPCDAPVWTRLRRASEAGNSWSGAAADRVLNPRNRICNGLGASNERLVQLGRQLGDQLDTHEGSMRQIARQYRSTALQLRAGAAQYGSVTP